MFLLRYFLPNGKNLEGNDLSLRQCGVLVMSNRSVFRGLLKLNTHFAKGNVWQYDKLNVFRYHEIYSTNDSLLLFHNWWILKIMKRRFNKNVYFYYQKYFPNFPNFSNFSSCLNLLVRAMQEYHLLLYRIRKKNYYHIGMIFFFNLASNIESIQIHLSSKTFLIRLILIIFITRLRIFGDT